MSADDGESPQRLGAIGGFRLVTVDLPRLLGFYRDVLGFFPEGSEQAIGADELDLLGLGGSGWRQALRLGGQSVAIEQFDPPGQPYPAGANAAALFFQHLALVVADIGEAYRHLSAATPISEGGPQHLPAYSGGVHAFKFRDPDGHPLEILQFSEDGCPEAWQVRAAASGQIGLGIDHSAISVADAEASAAFYASLGLSRGKRTLNQGPEQQRLDDLSDAQVTVVAMQPEQAPPHLELLGYAVSRGATPARLQANDMAATRIVWHGFRPALLRDPDGHLHQITRQDPAKAYGSEQEP